MRAASEQQWGLVWTATCQRNVIRHCRQSTVGGTNATLAAAQSQEN